MKDFLMKRKNRNIVIIENELFNQLEKMLINNFESCSIALSSVNKFYSPFVLALIGIFLNQTKHKRKEPLLKKIETKLNETHNNFGIYNFYGDDKYFYDVDSTSIVNTFFLLRNCKTLNYHNHVLKTLTKNKSFEDNGLQTWLNRDKNNIDWFVNYNYFIYSYLLNEPNSFIEKYLITEKENFIQTRSNYYSNIYFPSFLVAFNNVEFNVEISLLDKLLYDDDKNLFHYGINILNGKFEQASIDQLQYLFNSDYYYFNSKKGYYSSKELNSAILLYLINKGYHNE